MTRKPSKKNISIRAKNSKDKKKANFLEDFLNWYFERTVTDNLYEWFNDRKKQKKAR